MIIEQYTDADDDIHSHIVLELDDVQPSLIHVVKTRINTVSKDFKDVLLIPSRSDIVWRKRARFDVDVDVDDRCFDNITYCLSDDSMYAAILVGNKLFVTNFEFSTSQEVPFNHVDLDIGLSYKPLLRWIKGFSPHVLGVLTRDHMCIIHNPFFRGGCDAITIDNAKIVSMHEDIVDFSYAYSPESGSLSSFALYLITRTSRIYSVFPLIPKEFEVSLNTRKKVKITLDQIIKDSFSFMNLDSCKLFRRAIESNEYDDIGMRAFELKTNNFSDHISKPKRSNPLKPEFTIGMKIVELYGNQLFFIFSNAGKLEIRLLMEPCAPFITPNDLQDSLLTTLYNEHMVLSGNHHTVGNGNITGRSFTSS